MLWVLGLWEVRLRVHLLLRGLRMALREPKTEPKVPRDRRSRRMVLKAVRHRAETSREARRGQLRQMRVDRPVARVRQDRQTRVGLPDRGAGRLAPRGLVRVHLVRRVARRVRAPLVARRARGLAQARLLASRRARAVVSAD